MQYPHFQIHPDFHRPEALFPAEVFQEVHQLAVHAAEAVDFHQFARLLKGDKEKEIL